MASTKRAYKLQEFIAHTSNVNCLKIGRKTSRLLATGGEDHMVNLWNIGQPNAVLSLSGHTSAVETVNFDSAEVLVAAGATSGTIKLWDLEEAKIIRTLTGHRSSCTTVDFHPFGEFFASGSLDTNLKIWDIRRKGCIQTYKGHTRRVNAIRFTPDGRWVVSGGEDNTVKLWDLTAGKLLHNFKCHEGQIQCIDFHPNEFLLATGSTDRTVKFWDLESFEMIGSAGPETTGVRSMIFNPDGRTLLCGLHESLKVFSWEPIRCHDTADVGWSGLSDMNIHEGKLLGCSYNRNCVGIWVVDISWAEPYEKSNTHIEPKSNFSGNLPLQGENNISTSIRRLSVSHTTDPGSDEVITSTQSLPSISQKLGVQSGQKTTTTISTALQAGPKMPMASTSVQAGLKTTLAGSATTPSLGTLKRNIPKVHLTNNSQSSKSDAIPTIVPKTGPRVEPVGSFSSANSPKKFQTMTNIQKSSKLDATSVIVPRTSSMIEPASDSRKEFVHGRMMQSSIKSKLSDFRKKMTNSNNSESESTFSTVVSKTFPPNRNSIDLQDIRNRKQAPSMHMDQPLTYQYKHCEIRVPKNYPPTEIQKEGRSDASVSDWEKREPSPSFVNSKSNYCFDNSRSAEASYSFTSRDKLGAQSDTEGPLSIVKDTLNAGNEDAIVVISKQQHEEFLISTKSRLKKLQVVDSLLQRNDIKDVLNAIETMSDHIVSADVVSVLLNRMNIITLEVCTFLLPVLSFLLEGKMDRSISISLDMLRNIVYLFGPIIRSTLSANLPIGVDLEAEKRTEWCNKCFIELEKTRTKLSSLTRRGGLVSKSAEELKHALRETF